MVSRLKAMGYISSPNVIKAMEAVPRHLFVPEGLRESAYLDTPLPIGGGQTISAPHMVGMMVEAAELGPGMWVLEVGGGSGYHASVMAELVRPDGKIFTMERLGSLASMARKSVSETGYEDTVEVIVGDGSRGLESHQPYDRIVVAAAAPSVPAPLKNQLKEGGKLVIPAGSKFHQELLKITRRGESYITENLGGCIFVPLIGEQGFLE